LELWLIKEKGNILGASLGRNLAKKQNKQPSTLLRHAAIAIWYNTELPLQFWNEWNLQFYVFL
jgi:uncharacterized protein YkwD